MSDAAHSQGHSLADPAEALRAHRGWFIALGVLLLVLGIIASLNLILATVASIYVLGVLMIMGGVAQLAHAARVRSWGQAALGFASGVLYAVAGLLAFLNPILASSVLTLMIAAALLVSGVLRIIVAIRERPRRGWGWVLAAGILSALAGLVLVLGWPINSLWVLGLILAVDLIFQGWAWLAFGLGLGTAARADRPA
jgi:uncharacterized membrane protein HdeD (DUF308 family)